MGFGKMAIFSLQKKKDGARGSFQSSSRAPLKMIKVYISVYVAIPFKLPWELPGRFFS